MALAAAAIASGLEPAALPSGRALLLALLSGVMQYALPFWLYLRALQAVPVTEAALVLALTPVFGVAGGVLVLGDALAPVQILGAALIVGALLTTARRAG